MKKNLEKERVLGVDTWILRLVIVLFTAYVSGAKADDYIISDRVLDDEIRISASSDFGGSITSLIFRGKEYIDAADKGRELQSASTLDGLGECYNPTEAGGSYDKHGPSSSKLLYAKAIGNILETQTNMAFWLMPGEKQPQGKCGTRRNLQVAQNSEILSNHILSKHVEIGCCGISNAIRYDVTYTIPELYSEARFEAVSLHTPPDFNVVYQYDLQRGELHQIVEKQNRGAQPIVFSTNDGDHAIGLYCAPAKNNRDLKAVYGFKLWPQTSVARCVFMEELINLPKYTYQAILFVGRFDEVQNSMRRYFIR